MTTHKLTPYFPAATVGRSVRPQRGLLERLAAWAERQPRHRRLGGWTTIVAASGLPRSTGR